jgi:hypothetical protein
MSSLFEGDDTITLTKTEAFRVLAALMDSLELIDRTSPAFELSWERLRSSIELLGDRIWPDA